MMGVQVLLARWLPQATGGPDYYWKLFLMELLLIGGPPLLYMLLYRMDIVRVNRFNGIKPAEVLLVVGMANFGYGVTIIINLIWYSVASRWGTPAGQQLPSIENGTQLLVGILAIGIVPAVVEEFLFRGLILRGYERFGSRIAIVMTGILFGMLHLQLMSIPSIILVGIIISYVVYRTNSYSWHDISFFTQQYSGGFIIYKNVILQSGCHRRIPRTQQLPKDALITVLSYGELSIHMSDPIHCLPHCISIITRNKGQIRRWH